MQLPLKTDWEDQYVKKLQLGWKSWSTCTAKQCSLSSCILSWRRLHFLYF